MDAARGALRGGASEVHVISLESLDELPAGQTVQGRDELHEAVEEGIRLHPGWGPTEDRRQRWRPRHRVRRGRAGLRR